jgi:hypothetical protein
MIVTNAGRDAVDAEAPITNGVDADGEVVWSCSPVLFSLAKDRRKRLRTKCLWDTRQQGTRPARNEQAPIGPSS